MAAGLGEFVTIIVDGYQLAGFETITVRRSMQNAAIGFTIEATWPGYSPQAVKLRNGEQIEIRTQALADGAMPQPGAGDLLCLGAVDDYESDIGEGAGRKVALHGRSNARDIVDCPPVDHPTLRSENKTLLGVAQDLGAEFAVDWATDQALDTIDKVQAIPGEPLFATIEREARLEGLMLAGQPDGSIHITRAGSQRHAGTLAEGEYPVTRWSIKTSPGRERSQVSVKGQRASGTGAGDLQQQSIYTPPNAISRHRPATVFLEGDRSSTALLTRGKWHHLRTFGFGMAASPRLSRWRDDDGLLWTPGRLIAVSVPAEGIGMDMLVREATFEQQIGRDNGTTATLVLVDPRAHGGTAPMGSEDPDFNPGAVIG
jgi:prophage tail gpP-like protein